MNNGKKEDLSVKVTNWLGTPFSIWVHTIIFVGILALKLLNYQWSDILLILTTLLSLEAIYLALFIQMTVNRHQERLEDVEEDVEGIAEDIEDISDYVDEVQEQKK